MTVYNMVLYDAGSRFEAANARMQKQETSACQQSTEVLLDEQPPQKQRTQRYKLYWQRLEFVFLQRTSRQFMQQKCPQLLDTHDMNMPLDARLAQVCSFEKNGWQRRVAEAEIQLEL